MLRIFNLVLIFLFLTTCSFAATKLKDEGSSQGFINEIDCVGAGIACTRSGIEGTLTVAGGGGGGDSVSIDGVGVTDPDFVSTGDIDFVDTSNTVTANINAGSIVEADLNEDSGTPTDEDVLTYDSTGANFNWVAQSSLVAGTATALVANGANCAAGEIPLGVDASGAAEGCYEPTEADITDLSHTADEVGTLTTGDLCINDGSVVNCTVNTEAELETALDAINVLVETEIDASSELLAIMDDETGSGVLVFNKTPTFTEDTDGASVQTAIFEGNRATPADGDDAYITLQLSDDAGNQDEQARISWEATTVASGATQDGDLFLSAVLNGSLIEMLRLDGSADKLLFSNSSANIDTNGDMFVRRLKGVGGNGGYSAFATDSTLDVFPRGTGSIGVNIKGLAGQTGKLFITEDSNGVDFLTIDANGDVIVGGGTPTLTMGDAGEEDTAIIYDGNAQDYYIGLDDGTDDLYIGLGSTVGTTPYMTVTEGGDVGIGTTAPTGQLEVVNSLTTHGVSISQDGVLAAAKDGLSLYSNAALVNSGYLMEVDMDNASSTSGVVNFHNDGTGSVIRVDNDGVTNLGAGNGTVNIFSTAAQVNNPLQRLTLTNASSTVPLLEIDNAGTGDAIAIENTSTGAAISVTDGDIYNVAWTDYGGDSTITGFSTVTIKTIFYKKIGNFVFVYYDIFGTSNATTFTFTLPYTNVSPNGRTNYFPCYILDNGAEQSTPGRISLPASSATVTVHINWNTTGGFTASGGKEAAGQFWYEANT